MLLKDFINKLQKIYDAHDHENDPYQLILLDKFKPSGKNDSNHIYCGLDPNISIDFDSTIGYIIDSIDIKKDMIKDDVPLFLTIGSAYKKEGK